MLEAAAAGVWKMDPGARLFLGALAPNMLLVECRWTDWKPISARLLPEDERWNMGCAGRPAASDMREPDWERPCCEGNWLPMLDTELTRFMADEGIGIAVILL